MRKLVTVVLVAACTSPTALLPDSVTALAATNTRLFWQQDDGSLLTANLAGENVRVVARPDPARGSHVLSQSIQLTTSAVYWMVDGADTAKLWRANLDGSSAVAVVTLQGPSDFSGFSVELRSIGFGC